jgi:hypothetical protein
LAPGSGIEKNPDPGSGMNILLLRNKYRYQFFGLKNLNSLMQIRIRDFFNTATGIRDGKSRIRDPG